MKVDGSKTNPPSLAPSKTSTASALLASNALAEMTTAATAASFSEAFTESLGAAAAATLTVVALEAVAPMALRPVKDGMETAEDVTLAIVICERSEVLVREEEMCGIIKCDFVDDFLDGFVWFVFVEG